MTQYEILDIVDDNDQVIGQIERTDEWNKTRLDVHRYIHVFVLTSDGRIVAQQRKSNKVTDTLKFDAAVGGLVVAGQTYEEAAYQEMQEELGIEGDLRFVSAMKDIHPTTGQLRAHVHIYDIIHDGPYTNWEEEAERLEFFTADELQSLSARFPYLFTTGFLQSIQVYFEGKKT